VVAVAVVGAVALHQPVEEVLQSMALALTELVVQLLVSVAVVAQVVVLVETLLLVETFHQLLQVLLPEYSQQQLLHNKVVETIPLQLLLVVVVGPEVAVVQTFLLVVAVVHWLMFLLLR
jgi:hypothetical protein